MNVEYLFKFPSPKHQPINLHTYTWTSKAHDPTRIEHRTSRAWATLKLICCPENPLHLCHLPRAPNQLSSDMRMSGNQRAKYSRKIAHQILKAPKWQRRRICPRETPRVTSPPEGITWWTEIQTDDNTDRVNNRIYAIKDSFKLGWGTMSATRASRYRIRKGTSGKKMIPQTHSILASPTSFVEKYRLYISIIVWWPIIVLISDSIL